MTDKPERPVKAVRGARYRHRKGGVYTVTGFAFDCDTGDRVVIYKADDPDEVWIRDLAEFEDGRFTRIDADQSAG